MAKNWNSIQSKWTDVVSDEVKEMAQEVRRMRNSGLSVSDIASHIGRSKSRVYELLRD